MATITITDRFDRSGYSSRDYKQLGESSSGRPFAQREIEDRRAAGLLTFVWYWKGPEADGPRFMPQHSDT